MRITAAVTPAKSEPFVIETLELEEPRADEVRVRIVASGVCHTDLVVRDQHYPTPLPAVLGHEGAGIIDAVGERVTRLRPGDPVVLSFKSCGTCHSCREGERAYCLDLFAQNFAGTRPDGSTPLRRGEQPIHGMFFAQSSFATYALAHESNTVKVRADAPLELLGPLGCGVQTGAGAVMNTLNPRAGTSIAVFGAGSVGLSAVMAAHAVGCTPIIAIDPTASRREIAKELGATHVVDPSADDPVAAVREITGGGAFCSLETSALPKVFRQAVDCLTLRGVCGLIGAAPLGTEATFDMNEILFGRTIRGVIEGDSVPDIFIPRLVELHLQGRFPFDRLVRFYRLDEINAAARDSEAGEAIKPILRMPH
jgi:aryl-alcohol dehydrogenase